MRMDRDRWHLWGGYLRPRDKFLHGKIANLLAVSRVHSAPKNNEVVFGKHLDFLREHQRPKLLGLRGRATTKRPCRFRCHPIPFTPFPPTSHYTPRRRMACEHKSEQQPITLQTRSRISSAFFYITQKKN